MRTCKPLNDDSELSLPAYDYDSHVAGKKPTRRFPANVHVRQKAVINRHAPAAADDTPPAEVGRLESPRGGGGKRSYVCARRISRFPKTNPGNESPRLGGVKRLSENHQTF